MKYTYEDYLRFGWDGKPGTLDKFKKDMEEAFKRGWNPNVKTLDQFFFDQAVTIGKANTTEERKETSNHIEIELSSKEEKCEDDEEEPSLSYSQRRRRAEEMGWDEEEMDLEEFEDYFIK